MVPGRSLRERGHVSVASARHQWDDGRRRLAEEGLETARSRHLAVLIDAVTDELRRRLGPAPHARRSGSRLRRRRGVGAGRRLRSARPKFRAGVRDTALVQDAPCATRRARATTNPEWRRRERRNLRAREHARARRGERRRRARLGRPRARARRGVLPRLALGRAVEQGPEPGDDSGQTLVRTLVPDTLTPQETVTVTVSNP